VLPATISSKVSLVAILDADKQGFLRSERSLVQTIGRAARNQNGRVIMYADSKSPAMIYAINETNRRRNIQMEFNIKNNVTPVTIQKDIRAKISLKEELVAEDKDYNKLTKKDKEKMLKSIEQEMKDAAKNLNFEKAAELRDLLFELKTEG
jgi:excinuclease ABC subunit B